MNFREKLENYADIIVSYGLNIQKGQTLLILTEPIHRSFASLVGRMAYERGARYVDVSFASFMESDPVITHTRTKYSAKEDLSFLPPYIKARWDELVRTESAVLAIRGSEFPDLFRNTDPEHINEMNASVYAARESFYGEGIGRSKVHWRVATAATPAWASEVFPKMLGPTAEQALWDRIFKVTRAEYIDGCALLGGLDKELKRRAKVINGMHAEAFHIVGPDTDLVVGISPKSLFDGGTIVSSRGVLFQPNIPSEEIFTTTDCRKAYGYVKATKPVFMNNQRVDGLKMAFSEGVLTDFVAKEGHRVFEELIKRPGAKRINELAFVGTDSPVFKTGLLFKETLFDEQAACHIALGHGFKFRYEGYEELSDKDIEALGFNPSPAHQDIMISDKDTDVFAVLPHKDTDDSKEIQIIKKGRFVI